MEHKRHRGRSIVGRLAIVLVLVICAVAIAQASSNSPRLFNSPEVAFTDSSAHGLAIVPASCPSSPYDGDAPYGCSGPVPLCPNGTPAPNASVAQCTCAQGNQAACSSNPPGGGGGGGGGGGLTENGVAVTSCDVGYTQEGTICNFTGCPTGYVQGEDFGTGYPECVFVGCPAGYSQEQVQGATQCIQDQCVNGYICGADGNLYLENTSCQRTLAQTCSYGCAGGACFYPTPSSDIVALPNIVKTGKTANVSWAANNVQSCTISGTNGDAWSCTGNACAATTTKQTGAIDGQTTYVLRCTGLDGSHLSGTAVVDVVPNFLEQ